MQETSSLSLHLGRETEQNLHQERCWQGRGLADCDGAAPDLVDVAPKGPKCQQGAVSDSKSL